MRVAFTLIGGINWTGGYNYLLNLIRALKKYSNKVEPLLFVGSDVDPIELEPFQELLTEPIVHSSFFDVDQKTYRLSLTLLRGRDVAVEDLFNLYHIDAVFEAATFYGFRFNIPVVSWIPDFQHRHLPGMFSAPAYWKREMGIRAQISSGRIIMLSSEDARSDCEYFYPKSVGNTCVVPFAVEMNRSQQKGALQRLRKTYDLPDKFYYLPNQFWKHKNHKLVIDGLKILKTRDIEVVVVSSGKPKDPRHPELYDQLVERVQRFGLVENFKFLGMIPYSDLVGLMLSAKAVINPSLFEGWSTTVEECKSLGVPMLLSDIPVHREQAGEQACFFDSHSVEDFVDTVCGFNANNFTEEHRRCYGVMSERMHDFCHKFERAVSKAIGSK